MKLEEVSEEHESAYLAMLSDYREHDRATYEVRHARKKDWDTVEFKKFLKEARAGRLDWKPGPGKVSVTRYVLIGSDGSILANGLMRFPLDEKTELEGGNLEVDVPPSLRRRNHGSMALALMLFEAVRAGLRRVLVTCPADDPAARRVIAKNRGVLEDVVKSQNPGHAGREISRHWIHFS
jgi:predicted acetyltransferase